MKFILSLLTARRQPRAASPASSPFHRQARRHAAFSLIELMSVVTIITIIAGVSVPAFKGVTGANALETGAAKFSGLLTLARSEAIAQHTIVRFVIATDWSGKETDANYRRMSLWAWRDDTARYEQFTPWEELPVGIIVERELPAYVQASTYASADASTVRGSCVLDELSTSAAFSMDTNQGQIAGRFIEFLPSGGARIPDSSERRAIFIATQGYANPGGRLTYTSQSNGRPTNWAQVNVDTLTGRVHVYRP
jgi:prepilin-type N-terminal cleavage/methylation domain-containing protein